MNQDCVVKESVDCRTLASFVSEAGRFVLNEAGTTGSKRIALCLG